MLRDLEQLIVSIKDYEIRMYMAEALKCYHAGSYRACVILSFVAGMYDLKAKVDTLASSHNEANKLNKQINELIEKQNSYEQNLIDGAFDVGIVSPHDHKTLNGYKDTRNSCAHPGGHLSSPEEARNVFTGIYDILLSKPPKIGFKYKEELIEKLKDAYFFPEKIMIPDVAEKHFSMIHTSALPTICHELVKVIANPDANSKQRSNAARLLAGFTLFTDDDTNIKIQGYLSQLIEYSEPFTYVIELLESNVNVLKLIHVTDQQKVIVRLKHATLSMDTAELIYKIVLSQVIDEKETLNLWDMVLLHWKIGPHFVYLKTSSTDHEDRRVLNLMISGISRIIKQLNRNNIDHASYFWSWKDPVENLHSVDLDRVFTEKNIEFIESKDFDCSYHGTCIMESFSSDFAERVPDDIKNRYVLAILIATRRKVTAAEKVFNQGFKKRKDFMEAFSSYIKSNNLQNVLDKVNDIELLIQFFINTQQLDVLQECLSQMRPENGYKIAKITDTIYDLEKKDILKETRQKLKEFVPYETE